MTKVQFVELMAMLTETKTAVTLSQSQLQVWYGLLSAFPVKTVQQAVLTLMSRSDPFTNVGAICEECRLVEGASDREAARKPSIRQLEQWAKNFGWVRSEQ